MALLDEDRLLPLAPRARALARQLYDQVRDAPIISPHGHTDPAWFAHNEPFTDAAQLLVVPDHYVLRMLVSQGVALESLGVARLDGRGAAAGGEAVWRVFAEHYHLFRGTPSRLWLDYAFEKLFGLDEPLGPATAARYYARINDCLATAEFLPRRLYERFNIEVLATTESATDELAHHRALRASGWPARIISTYRPDAAVDPEQADFAGNVGRLCALAGESDASFAGYLKAHRNRRAYFRSLGATATDHGHPSAATCSLSPEQAASLYAKAMRGQIAPAEAEQFRGHMLLEMARMSIDDGMVMQLHPGSHRSHSRDIRGAYGPDMGFDIPKPTSYVDALKPLLDEVGLHPKLTLILFTLDETAYGRELAPLAGAYPALRLGPAWWFFDSVDGMRRYRELVTETAGFYNTAGFNDDTRALCSIPARHDVARRVDAAYLAELTVSGRLAESDAFELIEDLTANLARKAYRL